jgi:hypothetical protein
MTDYSEISRIKLIGEIINLKEQVQNLLDSKEKLGKQSSLNGVSHQRELLIATLYGWQDYKEQGISIEDYVEEIESNL